MFIGHFAVDFASHGPDTPLALGGRRGSAESIAGPALATWLFVAWAYWVDRHRKARS